jgi:hypothetical protein
MATMSDTTAARRPPAPRRSAAGRVTFVVLGLLVLAVWLLAERVGTEPVVSQARSVAHFSRVELAGGNVVTVRIGSPKAVVVRARRNVLARITTHVEAGTLVIANTASRRGTTGPISVSVSTPSLESLRIARTGSGIVTVTGVDSPTFAVRLAGSGVVRAAGSTNRLTVSVGGSGDAELANLIARDARAVVSGSGRIVLTATGNLDASVPGSGVIQYRGAPARVHTSITGSGVVLPG